MSIICKQMYLLCTERDCSSFPGFDNQKKNKMMLPMSWREKKRKENPKPLNPWCKQEWQPRTQNKNSSDGYGRKQQQQWKNQNLTHLVHMLQFSLVTACRWRTSSLALESFPSPPSPPPPPPPASGWVLQEIKLHTSSLSTNIPKQKEKEFEGDDGVGRLFVCCCCCCCKTLNPKPSKTDMHWKIKHNSVDREAYSYHGIPPRTNLRSTAILLATTRRALLILQLQFHKQQQQQNCTTTNKPSNRYLHLILCYLSAINVFFFLSFFLSCYVSGLQKFAPKKKKNWDSILFAWKKFCTIQQQASK